MIAEAKCHPRSSLFFTNLIYSPINTENNTIEKYGWIKLDKYHKYKLYEIKIHAKILSIVLYFFSSCK